MGTRSHINSFSCTISSIILLILFFLIVERLKTVLYMNSTYRHKYWLWAEYVASAYVLCRMTLRWHHGIHAAFFFIPFLLFLHLLTRAVVVFAHYYFRFSSSLCFTTCFIATISILSLTLSFAFALRLAKVLLSLLLLQHISLLPHERNDNKKRKRKYRENMFY